MNPLRGGRISREEILSLHIGKRRAVTAVCFGLMEALVGGIQQFLSGFAVIRKFRNSNGYGHRVEQYAVVHEPRIFCRDPQCLRTIRGMGVVVVVGSICIVGDD